MEERSGPKLNILIIIKEATIIVVTIQYDLADSPENIKTQLKIHTYQYHAESVKSVRQTQLEVRAC